MRHRTGRCLCGEVTFRYEGPENWRGHCHCDSCRRATASPTTTFMGVPKDAVVFDGHPPKAYLSSPGVRRTFCGTCGTPVSYESDRHPNEIHLYAATLDDPADFAPQFHVHTEERLPWVKLADGLPRYLQGSDGPEAPQDEE
jgi:hypothetical protein